MDAYLKHGTGTQGPFSSESVPIKEQPLDWQLAGKTWTASGYGARIATEFMVQYLGKWRRVYRYQYANAGTLFIGKSLRDGIVVDIYQ